MGNVDMSLVFPLEFGSKETFEARTITKAEAAAAIDKFIQAYAAEHKLNYSDAFTAVRNESPELIRYWQSLK